MQTPTKNEPNSTSKLQKSSVPLSLIIEKSKDLIQPFTTLPKTDVNIACISHPESIEKDSLVIVSDLNSLTNVLNSEAYCIIINTKQLTSETIANSYENTLNKNQFVFLCSNIHAYMSLVFPLFDTKLSKFNYKIHPKAEISDSAVIGKNTKIGPFSYIGDNVIIEDDVVIGPNCTIEANSRIGSNTILHGNIYLGSFCHIGTYCEIHAHTTIGSDGFGFFSDQNYTHQKIPQLGKVVIEDRVEIGANCCIDRAALTETRIKKGTKLDNLCHIAHNCSIGENSLIAAGFFVAGSTQIGKNFTVGGNTVVSTHLKITDNVMIAGRSTVTNHITQSGQYGGYPLQPLKEALKTIATLSNLVEMRKNISQLMKHLKIKD